VVLTPHIAGPLGGECRRIGELMLDELRGYLKDGSLSTEVYQEQLATMA
jgi:phosphoglycerate dehydrogenase-like enzyme